MRPAVRTTIFRTLDIGATAVAVVLSPLLRLVGKYRRNLTTLQKVSDSLGFQIRGTHYYEPTYRTSDLPADTSAERALPGLDLNEAKQLEILASFEYADELRAIPLEKKDELSFGFDNISFGFGDADILYNMVRKIAPRRIIEIGSGQSTLVAQLAIQANRRDDESYRCEVTCIEPYEAKWLEATGVKVIRNRVEDVSEDLFQTLEANDILFIDSSHVIRPYGDVLVEYQRIVPRLKPGVVVHVHDIFTPRDYPEAWLKTHRLLWDEQYLLEAFLTYNSDFEVLVAGNWLKHNHPELFLQACPSVRFRPDIEPGSFWFRRRPDEGEALGNRSRAS